MVTPQRLLFPNRVRVYDPEEVTRIAQDECSEQSVGLSLGTKEAIWKSVINFYKRTSALHCTVYSLQKVSCLWIVP